jgi:hypothetical protein
MEHETFYHYQACEVYCLCQTFKAFYCYQVATLGITNGKKTQSFFSH